MAARGKKLHIATGPAGFKGADEFDVVFPKHTEIMNVRIASGRQLRRRPVLRLWKNLGVLQRVDALIPEPPGFAVLGNGDIYSLGATPGVLSQPLGGETTATTYKPQYQALDTMIVLADGGKMVKIDRATGDSSFLSDDAPWARFVGASHSYLLAAAYENNLLLKTEFKFCSSGAPDVWSAGNSGYRNINFDSAELVSQAIYNDIVYQFKRNNYEVWALSSAANQFTRQYTRNPGLGARYSVVVGPNDTIWYFGSDNQFYVIVGDSPKIISFDYAEFFQEKVNFPDTMYGLHFEDEGVIRWFLPIEGYCFTYNYIHKSWWRDTGYKNNVGITRLPIGSAMKYNNKTYVGDSRPTGKIYEWTNEYHTDDGDIVHFRRKYNIILSEGGAGKVNEISFLMKRGVGATSSTDSMLLRTRFDRQGGFKEQKIHLGVLGDSVPEVRVSRIGAGSFMELEIIMNSDCEYFLTGMTLIVQERR